MVFVVLILLMSETYFLFPLFWILIFISLVYKNDISKLNELQQYPSYLRLYNLLKRAIDQKVKIQKIVNLEKFELSIDALEVFLKD
jgi:hypothetical protein